MTWGSKCWCWWSAGVISFVFMLKNRLSVVYGLLRFARNDKEGGMMVMACFASHIIMKGAMMVVDCFASLAMTKKNCHCEGHYSYIVIAKAKGLWQSSLF